MRCFIVLSSFFLAEAYRRQVSNSNEFASTTPTDPKLEPTPLLKDAEAFRECLQQEQVSQDCQLFPALVPPAANKPLKFVIHEEAKFGRANFYEWMLVSDGERNFKRKPMSMGKARSTVKFNWMTFKATRDGPALFKFWQHNGLTNKPVFFVANADKEVIYTIRKTYTWGLQTNDPLLRAEEKKWKHFQKLYIYAGKVTHDFNRAHLLYEAIGRKSKSWRFYTFAAEGEEATEVAQMTRTAKEMSARGFDEEFTLTVDKPADVGVIMASISAADLHQNTRSKGQHILAGSVGGPSIKHVVDVIG